MTVLLTDEAVRALVMGESLSSNLVEFQRERMGLKGFLRYHATEGREALVEKVGNVLHREFFPDDAECGADCGVCIARAEAVVTALFGDPSC